MAHQQQWTVAANSVRQPAEKPSEIDEVLDLEDEAWQLYVRGQSARQIGQALGRSTSWVKLTVSRLLELRGSGRQQMVRAHVERLLDEVSLIRRAAWSGWEQSLAEKVRTVEKSKDVGPRGGGGEEHSTTKENRSGDSSLLRVLLECNKRESALRGIERPTAVLFQLMQSHVDLDSLILQVEAAEAQQNQPQLEAA